MERTATHDTEYVDIVLGYHHVLLFSLVFGALVFGSGYFIGYYRAQSGEPGGPAASRTATPNTAATAASPSPAVQVPAMLTQPAAPATGDVIRDMEQVSAESLGTAQTATQAVRDEAELAAAAAADSPAATRAAEPAPRPAAEAAQPAAAPPKPAAVSPPPVTNPPPAAAEPRPVPQAASKPPNASGNVYLQVSSFGEQQRAEKLIDDLAAEGFRALIDGQLIEGKHTVLVGPFSDFKTAVGKAKELKQRNREAFPIRR